MSTKISKSLAQKVAKDLCTKTIGVKLEEVKNGMSTLADKHILSRIPLEVLEFQKKFPTYTKTSNYCRLAHGQDSIYLSCSKNASTTESTQQVELSKTDFDKLFKLEQKKEELKSKMRKAEQDTIATLLNLSTFKKIKEVFPEAFALIPEDYLSDSNTTIALPMASLRETLGL